MRDSFIHSCTQRQPRYNLLIRHIPCCCCQVWVEQLAGRLLALEPNLFWSELQGCQQEERNLTTALANLAESVAAMRTLVADSQAAAAADTGNHALAATAAQQAENLQQVVTKLVQNFERLRSVQVELQRRAIAQDTVVGAGAKRWAERMQGLRRSRQQQQQSQQQQQQQSQQQQQQREEWRQAFRMAPRDVQQQLEASYVADVSISVVCKGCRAAAEAGDRRNSTGGETANRST